MTATDELRRLLDERGVEWCDSSDENVLHTTWNDMNCWFNEFSDGWTAWGMAMRGTPEQAIDATLGRGTCHITVQDNMTETEGMGDVWLECDACGWQMPLEPSTARFNYCPNCGRTNCGRMVE